MSGHHTIRLFSYAILILPFFFGALCCLIPASMHWNSQWRHFSEDVKVVCVCMCVRVCVCVSACVRACVRVCV